MDLQPANGYFPFKVDGYIKESGRMTIRRLVDPNDGKFSGDTTAYLCALTGPLAKLSLKGTTLIYYTIPPIFIVWNRSELLSIQ